jgi:DNA-binding NtrC family response regulator
VSNLIATERTAERLQMMRSNLYKKIEKYQLKREP